MDFSFFNDLNFVSMSINKMQCLIFVK